MCHVMDELFCCLHHYKFLILHYKILIYSWTHQNDTLSGFANKYDEFCSTETANLVNKTNKLILLLKLTQNVSLLDNSTIRLHYLKNGCLMFHLFIFYVPYILLSFLLTNDIDLSEHRCYMRCRIRLLSLINLVLAFNAFSVFTTINLF